MIHGDFLSMKTFAKDNSSSRQMSQSGRIIRIRTSLTADRGDLKNGAYLSYRVEERELMERDYLQYLECPTFGCNEVETLVDEYIDRELPEAVHLRFDEHLGCCEECRALVFDIQKIVEIARTLDKEPLPLGLSERLRQRLADEVGYEPPPPRKLQIVK